MRALGECSELSDSERNMLVALLGGYDSLDIARDYRMSVPEIEGRIAEAFAKLGIASQAELEQRFRP